MITLMMYRFWNGLSITVHSQNLQSAAWLQSSKKDKLLFPVRRLFWHEILFQSLLNCVFAMDLGST